MAKEKKTTSKEAPLKAPAPDAQTQAQPGADLSIGDLKNLATIIDVASTRGAFRANEMATVGVMFNKLSAFLAKVAPNEQPNNAIASESATAEAKK